MQNYPNSYYIDSLDRNLIQHPSLLDSHECDLCIIGGGFTGLSTAIEASKKGLKVILLEQNKVAWGASGRNGGQIGIDISNGVQNLESKYGFETVKSLWNVSLDAVKLIDQRIDEFKIQCDKKIGNLSVATNHSTVKDFESEIDYYQKKLDYHSTKILTRDEVSEAVGSNRYFGGHLQEEGGHLHPLKYALGLADAALSLNVDIYEDSKVIKINEEKNYVEVLTLNGSVKAKNIALCCNAYLEEIDAGIKSKIMPIINYMIATQPISDDLQKTILPSDYCVCDTNFDLNYYRLSSDKRMIFGGGVSYSLKHSEKLAKRTEQRMLKVFPALSSEKAEYIWGGYVGITVNRTPDIGQTSPRIFYAHGFSGHGVALTGIAGKIIANSIFSGEKGVLETFEKIKHRNFPGGRLFRMPLLVTISALQRMTDIFNA
jgi:gamma-glutamylputrescine oxidase|tara:strand:- start:1201 stop:2490 length:1290 start_codon:yes stop_codon:yes gene_type:complete